MKTKSLSLLLALALCITIGGVYAAWIYVETPMNAAHDHIGSFGLASAQTNHLKGTFTVDASNAHIRIDQTADGNYVGKLTAEGVITVKLAPSESFVAQNPGLTQITMKYGLKTDNAAPTTFTCPHSTTGNTDQVLFSKFDLTNKYDILLTKDSSGNYVGEISASALIADGTGFLAINSFTLDTHAKYTAFSTKLGTFGNIGIEITDPAANS